MNGKENRIFKPVETRGLLGLPLWFKDLLVIALILYSLLKLIGDSIFGIPLSPLILVWLIAEFIMARNAKKREQFMNIIKPRAIELLKTFRFAIVDLTAKTQEGGLSQQDLTDLHYTIGVATTNAVNLENLLEQDAAFYRANQKTVDTFMADAATFAGNLVKEGVGLPPLSTAAPSSN